MEVLQSDMASLMSSSKKSSQSFMDVVGADVSSSYDRPMQYQVFSDTFHISAGGQNISEGANIQIQIRDDNSIHYLKRSGIAFDFISNGLPHNMATLFSGLELSIGNVVISTPFQSYYVQQKLSKMGRKRLEPYANALCMKIDGFEYSTAIRINAGVLELFPIAQTHGGQDPLQYAGQAQAISNPYNIHQRQILNHFVYRAETNQAGEGRIKAFVPFNFIFPCIDDLPDDASIFTGYGQSIKMNIRTNYASECLSSFGSANHSYQLRNMQLVKCFSILDQPRADLVLKSNIQLPICKYEHWQSIVQGTTINAIYSVSRDDLITGLWFAFHTEVKSAAGTLEATNTYANLINNTATQYKVPLNYFPQVSIQHVSIHVGGEPIIINLQQLQMLHINSDCFGDDRDTYVSAPALRATKYAYHIDLRRYSKDLFGSSSKQTTTVQVQITLKTGQDSKTLPYQQADWDAASLANFRFYSYLEKLDFIECKNGVYSSK